MQCKNVLQVLGGNRNGSAQKVRPWLFLMFQLFNYTELYLWKVKKYHSTTLKFWRSLVCLVFSQLYFLLSWNKLAFNYVKKNIVNRFPSSGASTTLKSFATWSTSRSSNRSSGSTRTWSSREANSSSTASTRPKSIAARGQSLSKSPNRFQAQLL